MYYATIYPENDKMKFVHAENWLTMHLLTFWVGLKTYFPNPLNAQRVVVVRPGWEYQSFLHE